MSRTKLLFVSLFSFILVACNAGLPTVPEGTYPILGQNITTTTDSPDIGLTTSYVTFFADPDEDGTYELLAKEGKSVKMVLDATTHPYAVESGGITTLHLMDPNYCTPTTGSLAMLIKYPNFIFIVIGLGIFTTCLGFLGAFLIIKRLPRFPQK